MADGMSRVKAAEQGRCRKRPLKRLRANARAAYGREKTSFASVQQRKREFKQRA